MCGVKLAYGIRTSASISSKAILKSVQQLGLHLFRRISETWTIQYLRIFELPASRFGAPAAAGHIVGYETAFNIPHLRTPGYAMLNMMIPG
jgi:hypothetical protein